ncbi:hypothetical protein [Mesorhizobium sp. CAU 1741]|uniref:hypothetical protein n=1 Tax=Mesorhizobium sp. CAU 1741 TaxID=3140366 RepID=UPI00325B37C7
MAFRFFDDGRLTGLALAACMVALAGCQSGDSIGALRIPGTGGPAQAPAADESITVEELTGYCPTVTLADTESVYDSFARGGDGDASKLLFRASLTDATRACRFSTQLGMTIALAGRVVPGPAGSTGPVQLPVRITIYRDTEVIFEQKYDHVVNVADTIGATQFVVTDENITIPLPTAHNIRIFASFDTPSR